MLKGIRKAAPAAAGLAAVVATLTSIGLMAAGERHTLDATERRRLGGTYVRLTHGVTHYRFQGPPKGPVVVLVHGGTIPMWTWDRQIPALTAAGYRVLTYDTFGRGYSDRPPAVYNRSFYISQLRELVDALGIHAPFDLIGTSQGGGTAITFTARYPQRVRRLVLIAPVVNGLAVPPLLKAPIIGDVTVHAFGRRILAQRSQAFFANRPDRDRYTALMNEQMTYRGFATSALSMLRNDALGDFTGEYRAVGRQVRPVLLLWGTDDVEITRAMIDTARAEIPNVTFRSFDGVGHGLLFQQPDLVNRHLLEFLAVQPPTSG